MSLQILHSPTAAAVAAATSQEAQRAALIAAWAGGNVTVRAMNGATLRETETYGPWVLGVDTPRAMTLGPLLARSVSSTGAPTSFVFRAGSTDIFSMSGSVSPAAADIVLPAASGGISAVSRTNLSDPVSGKVTITANPALPVADSTATAFLLEISPSSTLNGSFATVTVTPNGPIPAGGVSVLLSASAGGVLGASSLSFTGGAISAQTTTIMRSTTGTSSVSMTNSGGLGNGFATNFTSTAVPVATQSSGSASAATVKISSVGGAVAEPFTTLMSVREGQFPSSTGIVVAGVSDGQVEVRNRWPDNSAKFVLISGRATVPAAGSISAVLQRGTPTGVPISEAMLLASGVTASLQFGTGPVVQLASLIGVPAVPASNGLFSGGRVRQLASGPTMSSWLYAAPASSTNAHITAWFEVRFYGGTDVHVLPWVENGWTRVAGCAGQAGTLTFTLGGSVRFTQADVHLAGHCRVVAQDSSEVGHWLTAAPDLYVAPDPVYMQDTGVVPPYFQRDTSGAATRLNGLSQVYNPIVYGQLVSSPRSILGWGTNNGDFDTGMADAGYHAGIGPIPEWEAFYLTSGGDKRARNATIANAMGYGRYGVHFRDENTLYPVNPADVPNKTLPQTNNMAIAGPGANQYGGSETLPDVAPYNPGSGVIMAEYWAATHHPSAGYMAYLLTGHEFFLELCQFNAGTCFLRQNNAHRNYGDGLQLTHMETTRGQAWGLRSIFQAATISVDGTAVQAGFANIATKNINYYFANYITSPCGSFGAPRPYSNFQPTAVPPRYNVNAWEIDFSICAWGFGLKMKPPVGSTALDNMRAYFMWHAQFVVGRLGELGNAATYGFNAAARQNSLTIANSSTDAPWINNQGPWMANWGEAFQLTHGASNSTNTTNTIGAFDSNNGFFPDATSYWANLQTAAAFAVDFDVPGAWEGYRRMTGASNWSLFDTSAATAPVGSLRSKKSPPLWSVSLIANQWTALANTRYDTWAITNGGVPADTYWGTNPYGAIITAYCDPANDPASNKQRFFGGGHGDGRMNGIVEFDWNTLQWRLEFAPTPSAKRPPLYVSDGNVQYPSGANGNGYFLPSPPLSGEDASYGTPLARVSTHMYQAAVLNSNSGTIHYFYGLYGEYSTITRSWSDSARALNVVGSPATIRRQLFAADPQLGLATPEQSNLSTGTSAIFDEVTDRFFVTLNSGDYASDFFHGFCVFNPYTRVVESVHNGGYPVAGWYWRVSTLPIKVGRKIFAFVEQATNYLQPIVMNRGVIFDMDTKAFQFFTLDGGTTAEDNTMPGYNAEGSSAETIPGCYDGTHIHRWNYNEAAKRGTLLSMGTTPISGTGSVGDPFVMPQTKRTLTGTPPSVTNYVYKRMIYLENAKCLALIPTDDVNAMAIRI